MKRPGFNSKRVVMVQAHYENGHYMPPVYVGDRSLKSPVSARDHLANGWKTLNRPREIYLGASRGVRILLLLMLIIGGVLVVDQHFKSPDTHGLTGGTSPLDPFTNLWSDALASNDLTGWQQNRASFFNDAVQGVNYIKIIPDANGPGIALSKTPVDISTIAGKELWFQINFRIDNGMTNNEEFGWYLTRNATLPGIGPDANYNPGNDPNVAIYERLAYQSGGPNILLNLLIQKTANQAINSGDYPGCQGGTGGGVCFAVTTQPATIAAGTINFAWDQLNFTGGSPSGTGSQSVIRVGGGGGASYAVKTLPWLQFQATPYYVGFFVAKGTGNDVRWPGVKLADWPNPDCSLDLLEICNYVPNSATLSPQIDTGGFFGPVIKALISIGVFILGGIAQFFGYVYNAFITAMDTVGNFLGLGAIGSAFAGALKGFADWIINIFGNIFLQSLNFVNFITSGLTLMINGVSNYWAGATAFIGQLVDLLSQGWTFVTSTLKFGNLGIKWLVVVWLVWGILASADSIPGFMNWFTISMLLTVRLFHGLYWIGDQAFLTILRAKQLIAQWM